MIKDFQIVKKVRGLLNGIVKCAAMCLMRGGVERGGKQGLLVAARRPAGGLMNRMNVGKGKGNRPYSLRRQSFLSCRC
jgi:hypothetical protein